MLTLTEPAQDAVTRAIGQAEAPVIGLRVVAHAGGCAGYQYGMQLEEHPGADDTVVNCGPVTVLLDQQSAFLLDGTVIDFVDSTEGRGFTFDNPNGASRCGCGKSFSGGDCPSAGGVGG